MSVNSETVTVLKDVVSKLPEGNRFLLSSICRLLQRISKEEAITKMGVKNLVIVFSATLNCSASNISHFINSAKEIFPDNLLARTKKEKFIVDIFDEDLFGNENKKSDRHKPDRPSDVFDLDDLQLPPVLKVESKMTKKRMKTIFDSDDEDEPTSNLFDKKVSLKKTYKPELDFLQ